MTDFAIILRSLRARMFSTVTTVLTVAIAVGLMLVLLAMRDAGRQAFSRGTGNMHLLVSRDASPMVSVLNAVFYANPPQRPIEWAKFKQIAGGFPLEWAIPTQQGDSYLGFPVLATTPEFFTEFEPNSGEPWKLRTGRFLGGQGVEELKSGAAPRDDSSMFEIVAGATAAQAAGLTVGDEVYLTHGIGQSRQLGSAQDEAPHVHKEFTFKVVGVLEPTGSAHDRALFTHLNAGWILHAHDKRRDADPGVTKTTPADVTDEHRLVTGILLRVATRQGRDVSAAMQSVFDQLRRDPTVTVAQPTQQINALFRIVGNIDRVLVAMAGAVMLSSGVGIMLALYNSMHERRRQIAVLRVLGCSRGRVFGLVLTESAVIGLLGAAAGVVLALAGARVVSGVLKREIGLTVNPAFGLDWVLLIAVATVLLGAAAGLVPAAMAYRTGVAKNLRAE